MNDTGRIERWNLFHAIALLAAGVASFAAGRTLVAALVAAVSFVVLVRLFPGRWTPAGRFGAANTLTSARLFISLCAAVSANVWPPHPVFALVWLAVFALDGLDGYLARRRGETSLFGEYFDKESDALFVLLLGFSLYVQDVLGAWVLAAGAMRYVFVLAMHLAPTEGPNKEYRSRWARYIYTGCILSFIAAYLLPPLPATALAMIGTVALVFSFLHYFRWLFLGRTSSPPTARLPLFLATFLVLNSLLLLPAHLGASSESSFFPVPRTETPTPTLSWERGWYDIALFSLIRRPNQDLFRLSADLAVMVFAMAWWAGARRRGPWRSLLVAVFVTLLFYEVYEAIAQSFFHRPGMVYEDIRYGVNIVYLMADFFSARYAGGLLVALVALGALFWAIPRLFGVLGLALNDLRLRRVLRLATAPFLLLVAGAWFWYGPASDDATLRSSAPRIANNAALSLDAARRQREARTAPVDSTYFRYLERRAVRKPSIYLILIESYGRILHDDPEMRGPYAPLLNRTQRQLADGGWMVATTTSVAPVTGGLSWLSMNTVLSGIGIDNRTNYLRLKDRADTYPHLVRYLAQNGWQTLTVQPPTRARPGLPAENPLGFDRTVYFDDLAYTGRPYSLWIIPDQYSLNYTHERYLPSHNTPFFVFFETASTHAPWDDTPPLVDDWRSLQMADANTAAAAAPSGLADKLTTSILDHMQKPRGDTANRYLGSIVYDIDVITRYLLTDAPDSSLVVILGDHQPPMLPSESFETPAHVITKDPQMLARFQAFGFRTGMHITPHASPISHAGVYSLLVDVLSTDGESVLPGPDYRPAGVSPSILWKNR